MLLPATRGQLCPRLVSAHGETGLLVNHQHIVLNKDGKGRQKHQGKCNHNAYLRQDNVHGLLQHLLLEGKAPISSKKRTVKQVNTVSTSQHNVRNFRQHIGSHRVFEAVSHNMIVTLARYAPHDNRII